MIMYNNDQITGWVSDLQDNRSFQLHWRSCLDDISDVVASVFVH